MAIYLENPFGPLPDVNKKITPATSVVLITGAKVGLSAGVAKKSYHRFLFLRVFTQNTQHSACFGLPSAKMLRVFAKMLRVSAACFKNCCEFFT